MTITGIIFEIMGKDRPNKSYLNLVFWTLNENRYEQKGNDNKFRGLMIKAVTCNQI